LDKTLCEGPEFAFVDQFHIIPCPCARNCTLHVERGQVVATWSLGLVRSSCVTYLARSVGGHLVPGNCQVLCYIFSDVSWWSSGPWDLSGLVLHI
jgi:hypothetical protein